MKIKVVPNFREEHQAIEVDRIFPTTHSTFISPTGGGKSNLLVNLLSRKKAKLCYYYNRVYIVNPTLQTDHSFDIIKILQENYKVVKRRDKQLCEFIIIDEIEDNKDFEDILDFILNDCKDDLENNKLLIMDDCLPFMTQNNQKLQEIYTAGRHYNLFVWACVQSVNKLPRVCRLNSLNFIIFKVSQNELKNIAKQIADDENEFITKYKEATRERYSFMVYRIREDDEHKFSQNFERYI